MQVPPKEAKEKPKPFLIDMMDQILEANRPKEYQMLTESGDLEKVVQGLAELAVTTYQQAKERGLNRGQTEELVHNLVMSEEEEEMLREDLGLSEEED